MKILNLKGKSPWVVWDTWDTWEAWRMWDAWVACEDVVATWDLDSYLKNSLDNPPRLDVHSQ